MSIQAGTLPHARRGLQTPFRYAPRPSNSRGVGSQPQVNIRWGLLIHDTRAAKHTLIGIAIFQIKTRTAKRTSIRAWIPRIHKMRCDPHVHVPRAVLAPHTWALNQTPLRATMIFGHTRYPCNFDCQIFKRKGGNVGSGLKLKSNVS